MARDIPRRTPTTTLTAATVAPRSVTKRPRNAMSLSSLIAIRFPPDIRYLKVYAGAAARRIGRRYVVRRRGLPRSAGQHTEFRGPGRRVPAAAQPQLGQDGGDVGVHGAHRQHQPTGDL